MKKYSALKIVPKTMAKDAPLIKPRVNNFIKDPSNVCSSAWLRRNSTFDLGDCSAIVAEAGSGVHDIYQAPDNPPEGEVVKFSVWAKPEYVDFITLFNTQKTGVATYGWFDLVQGLFGEIVTETGVLYERGMSKFDADGYRLCWLVYDLDTGLDNFGLYYSPAEIDGSSVWDASGGEIGSHIRNAFFGRIAIPRTPNLIGNDRFIHWDNPNAPVCWLNGGPNDNNFVEQNPDGLRFVSDGSKIYYINQTPPLVSGVTYDVTIDIISIDTSIKIGASPSPFEEISSPGVHTFTLPGDHVSIAIWNDIQCDAIIRSIRVWPQ